jgi:hypothetical protein
MKNFISVEVVRKKVYEKRDDAQYFVFQMMGVYTAELEYLEELRKKMYEYRKKEFKSEYDNNEYKYDIKMKKKTINKLEVLENVFKMCLDIEV